MGDADVNELTAGACRQRSGLCDERACRYQTADTCALHVAERGLASSRADVARLMGITRKRVEQLERVGLFKVRREWIRRFGMATWREWEAHLRAAETDHRRETVPNEEVA